MESQQLQRYFQLPGKLRSSAQVVLPVIESRDDRQTDDQVPVGQSSQILNNGLIGDPEYFFVTGVIHMLQIDQKLINDLYQLKT